mmetsp:Transcript_59846/g.142262  ORF Transcript_59846/g.142262 Transcript_59846/m.142262 type:complete len:263 (+) Transcript_59846:2089-2877(+)
MRGVSREHIPANTRLMARRHNVLHRLHRELRLTPGIPRHRVMHVQHRLHRQPRGILRRLHAVSPRHIQHRHVATRRVRVHGVPRVCHHPPDCFQRPRSVPLQCGLRRRSCQQCCLRGMRSGRVQLCRRRGCKPCRGMPGLQCKLVLAGGQCGADGVHVQRGILRSSGRILHRMPHRHLQLPHQPGYGGVLPRMPRGVGFARSERRACRLPVQPRALRIARAVRRVQRVSDCDVQPHPRQHIKRGMPGMSRTRDQRRGRGRAV